MKSHTAYTISVFRSEEGRPQHYLRLCSLIPRVQYLCSYEIKIDIKTLLEVMKSHTLCTVSVFIRVTYEMKLDRNTT